MADTSLVFNILGRDNLNRVFARIRREALKTSAALKSGELASLSKHADNAARGFLRLASSLSNIPTAVQAVSALGSMAVSLSGVMGLLPAAGFAAAGAMIAVKLGADGAKRAFEGLNPALTKLKAEVSGSFERALIPAVRNLNTLLPKLTTGFKVVVTSIGGVATKLTAMLSTGQATEQIQTILIGTGRAVQNLGKFLTPVVAAFLRVGAVAMPILVRTTEQVGRLGDKFNVWVQRMADSGNVTQWIETGIATLKQFGQLLGNVGRIVGTVFAAFNTSGAGALGFLVQLTGAVSDFLRSVQGQAALQALVKALKDISTTVTTVLLTALRQLAPIIINLAPGFAEFARQVAEIVIPALNVLGPILADVAGFLSDNIDWLGPLTIALWGAVKAWNAVGVAIDLVDKISRRNLWVIIITTLIGLVVAIVENWDKIKQAVSDATAWVQRVLSDAWNWIKGVTTDAWNWVVRTVTGAAQGVWEAVTSAFNSVVDFVGSIPGRILSGLGDLGNLLVNAGRGLIQGLINGIKSLIGSVISTVKNLASSAMDAIAGVLGLGSPSKITAQYGVWLGQGLMRGMDQAGAAVNTAAQTMGSAALGGVRGTVGGVAPPRAVATAAADPIVIEFRSSGSREDDDLVEKIRKAVRSRGGNVQLVFGGAS